jgi:RNA polymerase sigma factor FliA
VTWTENHRPVPSSDFPSRLTRLLPLADRMARRLKRHSRSIESDDLVQSAILALLESERRSRGMHANLRHAEMTRMHRAMIDCMRADDWLSRKLRHQVTSVRQHVLLLQRTLNRAPTNREIAAAMSLTLDQYQKVVCNFSAHRRQRGDSSEIIAKMAATTDGPLETLLRQDTHDTLTRAIKSLPRRERRMLKMYYRSEHTLGMIATCFSISESRVCQLLTHAKSALHRRISSPTH